MDSKKHSQLIHINSALRSTDETECEFTANIDFESGSKCDMVSLMYVSIPKSYYLIPHDAATMTLVENGVNTTITIPHGNYNYLRWQSIIPGLLNAASPNHWTYTISYPLASAVDTGMFTYGVSGNGTSQPSFVFTTSVFEQFGFLKNSTNIFVANTLVGTAVINFQLEHNLFITTNLVRSKGNILDSIIATDSAPFGYINYVNNHYMNNAKKIATTESNVFTFKLCDTFGNKMHLNGLDWVMKLLCWQS